VSNEVLEPQAFGPFLLEEGFRQDALIHDIASQLGTKNGLFMVFAAFVFTAESSLAGIGNTIGVNIPIFGLGLALLLSLIGIGFLLRSAFLEKYHMPPALPDLRRQAETFFSLVDVRVLPEEERMNQFRGKFVNSLTRSIAGNFEVNKRIAKNLEWASWFVAISVGCLLLGLMWSLGDYAVTFLRHLSLGCA
jgi:hypothetical protein